MSVPLIAELKRRRVFRALVGYAIVAFAVLQVIEPVMHGLRLPDWTLSFVVVALAIGFPVVLAFAWVFDVSAGGIERTLPLRPAGLGRLPLALAVGAVAAYASTGRKADALAELDQIKASAAEHVGMRAWILAVAGDAAGARGLMRELEHHPGLERGHLAALGALHGMLGDSDRAFAMLDQAYAERDWMLRDVKVSPMWDPLRKDPRFAKLLQQMHLD